MTNINAISFFEFFYNWFIVTKFIIKTLAEVLEKKAISAEQWKKVGACIKLFHQHDIYHADLNARNILLTESGDVYLIDFDNSDFRVGSDSWKMDNLTRLKRSLLKFKKNESCFNFWHLSKIEKDCISKILSL